jgi:hypothetical protein
MILGFVHLPEKVLDKYFEIKGVLNLITCSMGFFLGGWGVELLSDFLTSQFNNKRFKTPLISKYLSKTFSGK